MEIDKLKKKTSNCKISVRYDQAKVDFLKSHNINISEACRSALDNLVKQLLGNTTKNGRTDKS